MLIPIALTILQQANTKIQELGSSLVDYSDSPKRPKIARQLDYGVQLYDWCLKFITLNEGGTAILGTIGDNDADVNAMLIKLQHSLELNELVLTSPVVTVSVLESCECNDLELVEVATAGASITLPMANKKSRNFVGDAVIAGNKTILFTNDAYAKELKFYFSLDAPRDLEWPSEVVWQSGFGGWDNDTKIWSGYAAGDYRAELKWNGSVYQMDIYGPYFTS